MSEVEISVLDWRDLEENLVFGIFLHLTMSPNVVCNEQGTLMTATDILGFVFSGI